MSKIEDKILSGVLTLSKMFSTMFKPEEIQRFTQLFLKDVITVREGVTHANMSAGSFVFIHI